MQSCAIERIAQPEKSPTHGTNSGIPRHLKARSIGAALACAGCVTAGVTLPKRSTLALLPIKSDRQVRRAYFCLHSLQGSLMLANRSVGALSRRRWPIGRAVQAVALSAPVGFGWSGLIRPARLTPRLAAMIWHVKHGCSRVRAVVDRNALRAPVQGGTSPSERRLAPGLCGSSKTTEFEQP
jgi:hypothetical protein